MTANFLINLNKIIEKQKELNERLLDYNINKEDYIKILKELSDIEPISKKIHNYFKTLQELDDTKKLVEDENLDHEIQNMISNEIEVLEKTSKNLEEDIKTIILSKDNTKNKNAILEIRAGTGGSEAALFATQLFSMYHKYAVLQQWNFNILSISDTGIGGYKEAIALIKGDNAFFKLKFESGVHRVQRIPDTESNGRIHTSTVTVAVLQEVEDIDINIDDKDLRIDTYRSSGAGGQHVNTTDSAVRITHLPTNIVVSLQDEKSQHKNKAKALKILKSRIYELERQKKEQERSLSRKGQIGSGDRSERIRTYNFPQSRVTDHRINFTLYKIDEVLNGEYLDNIINQLITNEEIKKLSEI